MKKAPELYKKMISAAAKSIRSSAVNHLPSSALKKFIIEILNDDNPFQEKYLRMMGVAGSIEIEMILLGEALNSSEKLQHYMTLLNTYFAYETLSDNIASGLSASASANNDNYELLKELLLNFNNVMIRKLQGDPRTILELLTPYADLAKKISVYQQTLLPSQMYEFSKEYLKKNPSASLDDLVDLEHSYFFILVLNIATCLDLLSSMEESPVYDLLKQGLINRYAATNTLLKESTKSSVNTLIDLGTQTILVVPSLAFCIGALNIVYPNPSLKEVINSDIFSKSLHKAASMVRLLNDMGTTLCSLDQTAQDQFFESIRKYNDELHSVFQILESASRSEDNFYLMSRIRKDLRQGEFNICLDGLTDSNTISDSLNNFFNRIVFYSTYYKNLEKELSELCIILRKSLSDSRFDKVISNFVIFHQKMYSKEYETKKGDYATTAENNALQQTVNKVLIHNLTTLLTTCPAFIQDFELYFKSSKISIDEQIILAAIYPILTKIKDNDFKNNLGLSPNEYVTALLIKTCKSFPNETLELFYQNTRRNYIADDLLTHVKEIQSNDAPSNVQEIQKPTLATYITTLITKFRNNSILSSMTSNILPKIEDNGSDKDKDASRQGEVNDSYMPETSI